MIKFKNLLSEKRKKMEKNNNSDNLNNKELENNLEDENLNNENDYLENEQINEDEIIEYEEIDKNKEMDLEDENIENVNEEEEENYEKEYPDFKSEGEIYSIGLYNSTLIIGDGEDKTTFYDLDKKQIIKSEKYNKDSVNFIKISNDKKYMITGSIDGTINIFDTNNFNLLNTINDQDSEINWIEWHPKGNAFCFGTSEGSIWVYLANNINNNFNFFSHTDSCTCGSFCNLGKNIISGSEDLSIKIYDLKNRKVNFTIKGKKFMQNPITCLNVCEKKPICAVASIGNEIAIINFDNANILYYFMFPEKENSIETIQWCNDDNYIMFSDSKSFVHIFDNNTLQIRSSIKLDNENITKMIKSNFKSYQIFASGSNGNFYIFDCRGNGSIIQKEKVHKDVIMDFIVTEKENFIITSSIDKTINLVKIVNIN